MFVIATFVILKYVTQFIIQGYFISKYMYNHIRLCACIGPSAFAPNVLTLTFRRSLNGIYRQYHQKQHGGNTPEWQERLPDGRGRERVRGDRRDWF